MQLVMTEMGGCVITSLARLMESSRKKIRQMACRIISNMATGTLNQCQTVLNSGLFRKCVALVHSGLCQISIYHEWRARCEFCFFFSFFFLTTDADEKVRFEAIHVVANAALHKDATMAEAQRILADGAVEALLVIVDPTAHPSLHAKLARLALDALAHLCYLGESSESHQEEEEEEDPQKPTIRVDFHVTECLEVTVSMHVVANTDITVVPDIKEIKEHKDESIESKTDNFVVAAIEASARFDRIMLAAKEAKKAWTRASAEQLLSEWFPDVRVAVPLVP